MSDRIKLCGRYGRKFRYFIALQGDEKEYRDGYDQKCRERFPAHVYSHVCLPVRNWGPGVVTVQRYTFESQP